MKIKKIKISILILLCVFFGGFNFYVYANADAAKNNLAVDSDGDGLTDAEELSYGTNPNKADTDGDSYSDGVEIKSGYDPLKPAPGDKLIPTSTQSNAIETSNLTNNFSSSVETYLNENSDKDVSIDDLNSLVSNSLSQAESSVSMTFDDLPAFDKSTVKILKQPYSNLSQTEQRKRRTEDLNKYLLSVAYILAMNSPNLITTPEGVEALLTDFQEQFTKLSQLNGDVEYFLDLENRLEKVLAQMETLEVPETAVDLHVKLMRLGKGYLTFRDMPRPTEDDPLAAIALITKFQKMNELTATFISNDVKNYIDTTDTLTTLK